MPELHLKWRDFAIALLIVLLAFALRAVLIAERASFDPRFVPPSGSDAASYVNQARGLLDGSWPDGPYYLHPLPSYVYAGWMTITGDSVTLLRLGVALLDALAAGMLIAAGWLLTRRAWGGWLAGLIYALYPVSVFYGTTLLIAPLAAFLLALILWLMLWQRERLHWGRSLLLGVTGGALIASRLNLAPLAVLWLLWLALTRPGWRVWVQHAALTGVGILIAVAPFTLWNAYATGGRFIPVATTGEVEIYMANHRDSDGLRDPSAPAFVALDRAPMSALLTDIAYDPLRFGGLMLRKAAILLSDAEPGNNIDYNEIRAGSTVLQVLPGAFSWLLLLALPGLFLLAGRDRPLGLSFGALLGWMLISGLLAFAFSRLRYPVVVPLVLLDAAALVWIIERWRAPRPLLRPVAAGLALSLALIAFPLWALSGPTPPVPPKRILSDLPAGARPLDVRFGPVALIGWRPLDAWPAAAQGWGTAGQTYAVELYWSLTEPVTQEYSFYLAYVVDGERVAGLDRRIGEVSYPPYTTQQWQPGQIIAELPAFPLPDDAPLQESAQIVLGVYQRPEDPTLPLVDVPMMAPEAAPALDLQTMAVYEAVSPGLPDGEPLLVFGPDGERIALYGLDIPERAAPGATIRLNFEWAALDTIDSRYNQFLHLMDASDSLGAQGDGQPVAETITLNWRPGQVLQGVLTLNLPDAPGTYTLYTGLIDAVSGERLPVDAPDNRPRLGTIIIEE